MSKGRELNGQPLTALVPLLQAIQGMVEVAERDKQDLLENESCPGSLSQTMLQRMLDRYVQQRSHLGIYEAQCARWRQEALMPQQAKDLRTLEGYLVHLKNCHEQLMTELMSWQSKGANADASLKYEEGRRGESYDISDLPL